MERLPVTLVTGFLGAGKTTLLNHILGAQTALRFAIIENEYGDMGVDGGVLGASKDVVFELNDGCVCCTVREDLVAVFEQLSDRLGEFDHIIIETTGLAEPGPVLRIFDRPALREAFVMNGVVTVVDAGHIEESMNDVSTCEEQIAYADLLVLNKTDSLNGTALDSVEAHLKQLNPLAAVVRAEHSRVDVERLLALGRRSVEESIPNGHIHNQP